MVKTPSKHGLERKFKSWRKGKSQHGNKRSSLKHQLRGFQRLLGKLNQDNDGVGFGNNTDEKEKRRQELQEKIRKLEAEISDKQQNLHEKKNAQKAHGKRFLDRQKLVRMERKIRTNSKSGGTDEQHFEAELYKIALDQIYVAHHPADVKYMPLFQRGKRVVDQSRALYRRAMTRKRILRNLHIQSGDDNKLCNWIGKDQYRRLPKDWSIQEEEKVYGGSISRNGVKARKQESSNPDDSRFKIDSQHEAMLQAAEKLESQLEKVEDEVGGTSKNDELPVVVGDSSSDNEDNSSDSEKDEADPIQAKKIAPIESKDDESSSSGSEDSDSDSSRDDEDNAKPSSNVNGPESLKRAVNEQAGSSSSSDDSSSSSDSRNHEDVATSNERSSIAPPDEIDVEAVDDFLVDASEETHNVFEKTTSQVPAMDEASGDKSRGWETQRQRPGAFKKRRVRR